MPRSALQPMLTSICLLLIAIGSAQISGTVSTASAAGPAPTTVTTTPVPVETTQKTTIQVAATTAKKAQKPKRLCTFPFWYHGWHHECLEYGSKGARWCSLTQNFTKDEMWRECARYDLMRYKCTIPFSYQGKVLSDCQLLTLEPLAQPTFWCSLVPSLTEITWAGLGTDWIFCEAPNATDSAYLLAVGKHRSLKEAAAETKTTVIQHKVESAATVVTTAASTTPKATSVHAVTDIQGSLTGAQKSINAASADGAAAASADGASTSGAGASSPSSGLGITLGVVGVVLTTVAVAAAFIVHRRHQYKRIDPLLSSEPAAEKSSYGGMQAYHD